jgi:hypothetical protein
MASKGYIERSDYVREMNERGCDPLASYALYDAILAGKGGVISPVVYDDGLAAYGEMIRDGSFARSFAVDRYCTPSGSRAIPRRRTIACTRPRIPIKIAASGCRRIS